MVKLTANVVLARSRASDLDNVRKLNCWGSCITDVSIIKELPNVQVATFSVNNITSLEAFSNCQYLEELYIRRNQISDLSEVCHLQNLPKLRTLWLADNPCAVGDRYRATVLKTLPNLHRLDNIVVQDVEMEEAKTTGVLLEVNRKEREVLLEGVDSASDHPTNGNRTPPSTADSNLASSSEDCGVNASTDITIVTVLTTDGDLEVSDAESPGADGCSTLNGHYSDDTEHMSPEQLRIYEMNTLRSELGLKPLSMAKVVPSKQTKPHQKFANLLQAALCLVEELDVESLTTLEDAIKHKIQALT